MTSSNEDTGFKDAVRVVFEEQAQKAYTLGWDTAVITIAQAIENMKVFGDTAASFAIFVKEFKSDMAFPATPTADTEEQQPTKVQPEQP